MDTDADKPARFGELVALVTIRSRTGRVESA
jgi:hypothetical protein